MKRIVFLLFFICTCLAQDKQLYTCGMHPNVIKEAPGLCPICEMDLTPIKQDGSSAKGERKILYWRAPMDPNEVYDAPGKSKMGMELVPVYSDDIEGTTVKISPSIQQNMGVRSQRVTTQPMIKEIVTTGNIQFDETRVSHISFKYEVWVEHSPVNFVGQHVKKGDILLKVYSPELVNAQQEYLTAINSSKVLGNVGDAFVTSAKARLKTWGVTDKLIEEITSRGKPIRNISIFSPATGVVTMLKARHGHYAKKGEMLMEIADISKVWMLMDIYEKDLPFVSTDQHVFVTLPYYPKAQFTGNIDYIYPVLNKKTRSLKARVVLHNPEERLKINMFVNAKISSKRGENVLSIPSEAVIKTGNRELVILDNSDHTFTPREVKLGNYFNGYYEILAGLNNGDRVVTSAQFMIDSESKLKEAIQKLIKEKISSEPKKSGDMVEINLPSIQCDQCVQTITEALEKTDGIKSVHIDLENKMGHIGFDKKILSEKDVERTIAKSGYHANNTKRLQWAYEKLASCCKEE